MALRGATLRVEPGEFVALMGRSGSGKSTLLQIMAGLDEPSAGTVSVAGTSLGGLDTEARTALRRRHIGVVFQRDNLWNHLTAFDNVALPGKLAGDGRAVQRARQLLAELGLEARVDHRPAALSGGEQQRVAIAQALINNPTVVLADEPTGELDRASEAIVLTQLDSARRAHGCALLVVTHSEEVAARATRVVRMEEGTCR